MRCWSVLFALLSLPLSAAPVGANPVCKPALTVKEASFSAVTNLRRYWSAKVDVDASRCASASGLFALGFLRLAENGRDLEFAEPFIWRTGETKVRVEFWADEAVQDHWIADVAPCPCRDK
jgi:hypothetical protein